MNNPDDKPPFAALANVFLKVLPTVRLTPIIDPIICALEPWFAKADFHATVTSGLRDPQSQLLIIRNYCVKHGVDKEFPRILTCAVGSKFMFENDSVFEWQPAWSRLLNIGLIINPPFQARALFDYVRDGVNKKGVIINSSPHFHGTAFDIGGGTGKPDVSDELAVVKEAFDSGTIQNWKGYLVERDNNCVHNDCIASAAA